MAQKTEKPLLFDLLSVFTLLYFIILMITSLQLFINNY